MRLRLASLLSRGARGSVSDRGLASLVVLACFGASVGFVAAACGSSNDDSGTSTDGGGDAAATADATADADEPDGYPASDATVTACTISENGSDPVALCTQKLVLAAWKKAARLSVGVAPQWDGFTGLPISDGGTAVHEIHADLGYASALGGFMRSATCYGDTSVTQAIGDDLALIQGDILNDFATLPNEYRGDTYFRLRAVASGLRFANEGAKADAVDAVAEAYGQKLASYFVDLGPLGASDAGVADAGDAGDEDGSAADAGTIADAGDAGDGGVVDDGVIGTITGTGGATYATGDSAVAATALLDLSARHATDNATLSLVLQTSALATFEHLYNRARASSGLFYANLTTASGGTSDTVNDTTPGAFSSDVQSQVAFALLESSKILAAEYASNETTATAYTTPFVTRGEALFTAMHAAPSFFDATHGGLYASITPATSAVDTTKTILTQSYFLEALRDDVGSGSATPAYLQELAPQQALLVGTTGDAGLLDLGAEEYGYPPVVTQNFGQVGTGDVVFTSEATANVMQALNHELPSTCQ